MVTTVTPPPTRTPSPPYEATPGRRLFHLFVAITGWVVFVYWWLLVLGRVNSEQVRSTVIFIVVTAVVVVALTVIWAIHNHLIFRRKGARTHLRTVTEDYSRDRLGRAVSFAGSMEALKTDPIVLIRLEHEGKTYRPASSIRRSDNAPFTNRIRTHEPH